VATCSGIKLACNLNLLPTNQSRDTVPLKSLISARRPPVEETSSFLKSLLASHGPDYLEKLFGFKAGGFLTYSYQTNRANVFCFLSSLLLLLPATTAVFGSWLSKTLYRGLGLAYLYDWRGFVRAEKETSVGVF
jgi:hypothetical protein